MTPTVSVIIPTYKHRDFVLATLDSVFAQTFTDYEVIVINDGSPDDTGEVLRPLAEAGRIRYIEQKNTGQSKARNRGIAEARGEFIALLDDDDLWPPDKLEWQVAALQAQPDLLLVSGPATVINVSGEHVYRTDFVPDLSFEELFLICPLISPGVTLIRADALQAVGGFDPTLWGTDDWDLYFRLAQSGRVAMEDRDALFYRSHDGNASNNLCRMLNNCCRVVETHLPAVSDAGQRQTLRLQSYRWMYSYLGWRILRSIKQTALSGKLWLVPAQLFALAKLARVLHSDRWTLRHFALDLLSERRCRSFSRLLRLFRPRLPQSL